MALVGALSLSALSSTYAGLADFKATWINPYGSPRSATCRIYVPPLNEWPRIRGIVFLYPGSGADWTFRAEDTVWQEAARSIGFALVGVGSDGGYTSITESEARTSFTSILTAATNATGRAEIMNAPIVCTGFSLGGFVSTEYANEIPERVIAAVGQRGSSAFGSNHATDSRNVPVLLIPGSSDVNGATNPVVTSQNFVSWRANDGHVACAVDWRADHNTFVNQSWSMTWTWIAECVKLRLPEGVVPSTTPGNPVSLTTLPLANGWLGHRTYSTSTTGSDRSSFVEIAPFSSFTGNAAQASWLPNETVAIAYRAMTSYDGINNRAGIPLQSPLVITGDAAPSTVQQTGQTNLPQMAVKQVGETINITVDPRDFDDYRPIVKMEYYAGAQLLGTQTSLGTGGWSLPYTFTARGIHTLTVVATDSIGNKATSFRTVVAAAPRQIGRNYYRFEKNPGFKSDYYDVLNLTTGATTGTGPVQTALPSSGAGSHFPRTLPFDQGQNASAAKFAVGNYDWVNHVDDPMLPSGTTSFTIEGFLNLASSGTGSRLRTITAHGGASMTDLAWQLFVSGEDSELGARNLVFQFSPDGKGQTFASLDTIDSDLQIQVGVDYYFAVIFNPADRSTNGARFFLKDLTSDGPLQEVYRAHTQTSVWNSSLTFSIGNGWDGLLDEIRLTNWALTPEELLINPDAPAPTPTPIAAALRSTVAPGAISTLQSTVAAMAVPILRVSAPRKVGAASLKIRGTSTSASSVEYKFNGAKFQKVTVVDNRFDLSLRLLRGKNVFVVRAVGPHGATPWKTFKITR